MFWYEDRAQEGDEVFMREFWEGVVVDYRSAGGVICKRRVSD